MNLSGIYLDMNKLINKYNVVIGSCSDSEEIHRSAS